LTTAQDISDQVFWIITVGSTLALILGLIFIRRLLQPIQQLSAATQRIGKGHLGETVPVSSTDEIGNLAEQFNHMSRDLAETTVSVETLRESEERFRRLSDSASEGIFIHQGSEIVEANDVFARMLGYEKADDVIGMDGWKFVGRQNRRIVLKHIRGGDERPFDVTLIDKDGTEIPAEVIGRSVPYDGNIVGVVAIRDIRERVEAAEARRQLERQLVQSERMASVGTVAAGIVHNLKNPLTGVMGFAELLKLKNPDLMEADRIVNSAQQMKTMIENILSKSRQKMTPEPVDINQLLDRELDFLKADHTFKIEVETDIHLANHLPNVLCVYTEMSQVFGNLLRNAVEAMHSRSVKILRVKSSYLKEQVVIEISDTGSGIKKGNLGFLFDPFFTTKTGEGKDEPQGTGLGLYMVKQMLDNFGATIEVDSNVDVGTTFRVGLPIEKRAFGAEEECDDGTKSTQL
jgi:PAS domain S-box-containing protein